MKNALFYAPSRVTKEALAAKHGEYDIVLANPPFGKKSSVTIVNEAGETSKESLIINRDDFWASTSKCEPHRHYSSTSLQHILIRDIPVAHPLPRGPDRLATGCPARRLDSRYANRSPASLAGWTV